MEKHETFGSTMEFINNMFNEVDCPGCLSVVDAQMLTSNYWGFTNVGSGNVRCNVCSSIIPATKAKVNRRT